MLLRLLAAVLLAPWPSAGAASDAGVSPADYDALAPAKALAVSPARPETVYGLTHGQPHDLAASIGARERCRARARAGEACEIVRLGDVRVTTGADILARVPPSRHPLFLWRYRSDGAVVYLAGSIHVLKPTLYPLPAQLEEAFQQADHLVLEVNLDRLGEAEARRRTLQRALLPDAQTLADVLPESLHRRLDRHLAEFGMSAAMVSRLKPAMVMNQIVVSRLLALGYLPESGVENHFLQTRTNQHILELETLDEQLALLFDQPMATQVALLAETLALGSAIEPLLAEMLVAWLSGDDATFLEAFTAQSGDSAAAQHFLRRLLDDRNRAMAERVQGFLAAPPGEDAPQTYFVLVGAAHLVGEQGVVRLLARAGFTGERIHSDDPITAMEAP